MIKSEKVKRISFHEFVEELTAQVKKIDKIDGAEIKRCLMDL